MKKALIGCKGIKNVLTLSLVVVISFSSCKKDEYEKPENLIDEDTMSDILYEIAVFYAAKSLNNKKIKEERFDPKTFIYEQFGVDSAQFANSSVYYASKSNVNIRIYKRVEDRLKLEKERLESESDARKKKDSIDAANKILKKDTTKIQKPSKD
ncbi:DUF4296 domain-containing protein [Flavobacteriaceae bacterium R38]|nr:DUF4296 domain-containing protein [Flavobacteriaceae bacterium R38]